MKFIEAEIVAYKLCRLLKSGEITPLFINKTFRIPFNTWLEAEGHETKGYKFRPYWHCMSRMKADHLSKKGRVWVKIRIKNYAVMNRPDHQGGKWYLAKNILFEKIIDQ